MSFTACVIQLETNSEPTYREVSELLVKIADNILKDPSNPRMRTLKKSNAVVSKKILAATGGLECLKLMGFKETDTTLTLPNETSTACLQLVRDAILKRKKGDRIDNIHIPSSEIKNLDEPAETIKMVVLPPFESIFSHPFLKQIEKTFHEVLVYEDKNLQERAKKLIPLKQLEFQAQAKLRQLQEAVKKDEASDVDISLQDVLIIELLEWFKNDFFMWMNSPDCEGCGGETTMSHMCSDEKLLVYTRRVEMHICKDCKQLTPFPRYNDLNILMETRRGRCGEWANVFTLFCRSLEWDTRLVVDKTDHVWTEVYSFAQKRWLHCDPCEAACDTPLVYENGWGKKLTYIIAYSRDEVQDVTWRYSNHHKTVLSHRKEISEEELIRALIKLRENRQKTLSDARKQYLTKRLLMELVEMMQEKKLKDQEHVGRSSGSLDWRLSRGETHAADDIKHIWIINNEDASGNSITLRYSSSVDQYEYITTKNKIVKNGWKSGIFEQEQVFRKEEKDWKMTYLARKEGVPVGRIKWKFAIEGSDNVIDRIQVRLNHAIYEDGKVQATLADPKHQLSMNQTEIDTDKFRGSKSLTIEVELSGGRGGVAWQHAQLFRQAADSEEFPFVITLYFTGS